MDTIEEEIPIDRYALEKNRHELATAGTIKQIPMTREYVDRTAPNTSDFAVFGEVIFNETIKKVFVFFIGKK